MDSFTKEFEHLFIKLEDIKSTTNNFDENKVIGGGGFGKVYKGEVSHYKGRSMVAFKRLDRKFGQGDPEFWKEVMMLSRYTHENLISLLGYCNEGGEMILVYEHASNGSLDRHLHSATLTWTQRIRICHDAAKGLCYLHEDKGNHRVLHRDIKSSNILLDENWKAKVSDLGLAKVGPSNTYTFFITTTVGTLGYIDPMYLRMGFLTKESDVYSFGVVLFEVLCGRLCFSNHSGNIVHIWKQRYEENKLDEIVFKHDLVQALDQSSLEVFSEIAFRCLQESREKRPKMSDVVKKLEIALKFQEPVDLIIPKEHEEIVNGGKTATNKVSSLEQHQKDGAAYEGDVSIPTASPEILELFPSENTDDLDTHKSLLEKITRSVLDENIQITGIYGIGGVGKTTLATEVAATVKDLFALVVFVTVSQPVDAESIKTQVEIAAKRIDKGEKVLIILDDVWAELKLHEVGIPCGTAFPSCKILLTSRQRSVCTAMNAHTIIYVESLPMEEAWALFKRVVGEKIETDAKLKQVAKKIVDGCGGLPLILQVVGKALKDKDNFKEWEEALVNIAKDETSDIGGALRVEFARLKLSYDYLESEQVKLVFLLCSMFPEDFDVPLERLAYYCVGLHIFTDLGSLEAARNKVQGAVKILKSSCLLLDGRYESTTKMHDVVRDVALLIASKGDNKFLVEARKNLTEWQPRNGSLESYTGISLMFNDIRKLPDYKLNIPRLKIFLMQGDLRWSHDSHSRISEISDEFTQAMKEVEVIDFENNNITSLPKSLNQLRELRMLNLSGNRSLCDVSILGELTQLEILILNETGFTEIPQEIGNLVNLRLFHAKGCLGLSHIAPGVLSKLRWLEELSIEYHLAEVVEGKDKTLVEMGNVLKTGFLIDSVESPSHSSTGFFTQNCLSVTQPVHGSTGRFNTSFKTLEIGELGKLTYLHLWVPHICLIPEGDYLKRLKTFCIKIGGSEELFADDIPAGNKTLILETLDDDISHLMHVRQWIEVCNGIVLRLINNLDKIMPMVYCEGFGIKTINIVCCDNLLYLVDSLDEMHTSFISSIRNHEGVKVNILSEVEKLTLWDLSSLKEIWNCADEYISLNNMVTLHICKCHKLEKLFSVSVVQGLVNLKELTIWECKSLTEVISDGDGETSTGEIDPVVPSKKIVFHRLAKIVLWGMKSLTSFYPGNATIEYPSLVDVDIRDCNKIEKWGYGTHNTPKLPFVIINYRKVNGSTIDEALAKDREAEELREKQRHDQRTEEGASSVGEE